MSVSSLLLAFIAVLVLMGTAIVADNYVPQTSQDDYYMRDTLEKKGACPENFITNTNNQGIYYCVLPLKDVEIVGVNCDMNSGTIGFLYDKSQEYHCPPHAGWQQFAEEGNCTLTVKVPDYIQDSNNFCQFDSTGYIGFQFQVNTEPECLQEWSLQDTPSTRLLASNNEESIDLKVRFIKSQEYNVYYTLMRPDINYCIPGPNDLYDKDVWNMTKSNSCYKEYSTTLRKDSLALHSNAWYKKSLDENKFEFIFNTAYNIHDTNSCRKVSFVQQMAFYYYWNIQVEPSHVATLTLTNTNTQTGQMYVMFSSQIPGASFTDIAVNDTIVLKACRPSSREGYANCAIAFDVKTIHDLFVVTAKVRGVHGVQEFSTSVTTKLSVPVYPLSNFNDLSSTWISTYYSPHDAVAVWAESGNVFTAHTISFDRMITCCVPIGNPGISVPYYNNGQKECSAGGVEPKLLTQTIRKVSGRGKDYFSTSVVIENNYQKPNYTQICAVLVDSHLQDDKNPQNERALRGYTLMSLIPYVEKPQPEHHLPKYVIAVVVVCSVLVLVLVIIIVALITRCLCVKKKGKEESIRAHNESYGTLVDDPSV